jgi:hypothetical protein
VSDLRAELDSPDIDVGHWPAICRDWAYRALDALDEAELQLRMEARGTLEFVAKFGTDARVACVCGHGDGSHYEGCLTCDRVGLVQHGCERG